MYPKATQKSETWYSSVTEFLKSKNCGKINCRSRLETRYAVCDEIERIVGINFNKSKVNKHEPKF
jgi:hypothetical protein